MRLLPYGLACGVLLLITASAAAQTISPTASVVHLRTTCGIDDCFTDTDDLTTWLWGGGGSDRAAAPSSGDRVVVHVGPGEFDPFVCDGSSSDRGYVSVVGSGRQQSRFVRDGGTSGLPPEGGACSGAIRVENCKDLDFSHLTAQGQTGVLWLGGGSATWSDVDMIGETRGEVCELASIGWYDVPGAGGRSLHYMFGSRAFARDHPFLNLAVDVRTAEIWFYGGDIVAEAPASGTNGLAAANVEMEGDLRLFGTSLRAKAETGASVNAFYGAWVKGGGTLHMHGAIINASASQGSGSIDASGVKASGANTFVHTPGTAFVVNAAGSGVASRVEALSGATVQSPFVWPAATTPPEVESLHGSDAFVDTDAGVGGNEAHLMVRDTGCTAGGGPWRDMTTGQCRP